MGAQDSEIRLWEGALVTGVDEVEEPGWAWTPGTHLLQNPLWWHRPSSWSCPGPLRHKPKDEADGSEEAKSCALTTFASQASMPQPCPALASVFPFPSLRVT